MAKQPSEQPSAPKPSKDKDWAPELDRPGQEHMKGGGSMKEPGKSSGSGSQRQPGRMPLPD